MERVDESEIVPNWRVFVSVVGREIEEKVPFKPLILTPPAKIIDNCLPLGFHRQFFCVRVPDIISKLKNKKNCQSEQDVDQVLYYVMDGRHCENDQHGHTVPKNRATCFYVFYRSI